MSNELMEFRLTHLRSIALAWKDADFRTQLLHAKDVVGLFEERFGYQCPWNVQIRVVWQDEVKWDPEGVGGWTGPNDKFTLFLPTKPQDVNQRAQALVEYYRLFPTIFGTAASQALPSKPLSLGGESNPFLDFGEVNLHAVALAWRDNIFREKLLHPVSGDATSILSQYLGFNSPWNFFFEYREDTDFKWENERWINVPQNRIELNYPTQPDNKEIWPVALTAYNNSTPTYPFTCD